MATVTNALSTDGLRHYVARKPHPHQTNPDHIVLMGITECGLVFTWVPGPRHLPNGAEYRMTQSPYMPTCLRCWWRQEACKEI